MDADGIGVVFVTALATSVGVRILEQVLHRLCGTGSWTIALRRGTGSSASSETPPAVTIQPENTPSEGGSSATSDVHVYHHPHIEQDERRHRHRRGPLDIDEHDDELVGGTSDSRGSDDNVYQSLDSDESLDGVSLRRLVHEPGHEDVRHP